jgi:hypothetical protein
MREKETGIRKEPIMSDTPKPETPLAQVVDETTTHQTTTTSSTTQQDSFSKALDDIFKTLKDAFGKVNDRQLVLKNKLGNSVFRLPLVWAIVLGVVSIALQIVPIVVIAVIIALVTKHQFVLEHKAKTATV